MDSDWLRNRMRVNYGFRNRKTQLDDGDVFGQNPIGALHQKLAEIELSCRLEMTEIAGLVILAGAEYPPDLPGHASSMNYVNPMPTPQQNMVVNPGFSIEQDGKCSEPLWTNSDFGLGCNNNNAAKILYIMEKLANIKKDAATVDIESYDQDHHLRYNSWMVTINELELALDKYFSEYKKLFVIDMDLVNGFMRKSAGMQEHVEEAKETMALGLDDPESGRIIASFVYNWLKEGKSRSWISICRGIKEQMKVVWSPRYIYNDLRKTVWPNVKYFLTEDQLDNLAKFPNCEKFQPKEMTAVNGSKLQRAREKASGSEMKMAIFVYEWLKSGRSRSWTSICVGMKTDMNLTLAPKSLYNHLKKTTWPNIRHLLTQNQLDELTEFPNCQKFQIKSNDTSE